MAVQWFNPYYVFGGEGGSGTGKVFTKTENGLVPAPGASAGDSLVLRSDGTWGQGGGGSATVGLGKQAKEAMWPGEYPKVSDSPFPAAGGWEFKDAEDFYKEIQGLPGYGIDLTYDIIRHPNVAYMQTFLKSPDVKSSIIKFIKSCHSLGAPVYAAWASDSYQDHLNTFFIYTPKFSGYYPGIRFYDRRSHAVRGAASDRYADRVSFFDPLQLNLSEEEQISLPSVSSDGNMSNVKITSTGIRFKVRADGVEVFNWDYSANVSVSFMDAQSPASEPESGKTLPYTPNYIGGCLSANISGYSNYGTLYSIKYDAGNLTFINTQGAAVISVPGATATGETELTLDDLQKIVYNEESSPKKLEIYDKTGTLRFTVNDTSSGT